MGSTPFAGLCPAVPTGGRRSKPFPRFFSVGDVRFRCAVAQRCRPEAGGQFSRWGPAVARREGELGLRRSLGSGQRVPTGGRRSLGRRLLTAPDGDDAGRRFRVTHRFHPLYGREYELLERGRYWGAERVFWEDERGEVRSLPASWTSAGEEDAFRVMSAGRSAFRVEDLLELAEVVRGVEGERSGGAGGEAGRVGGEMGVKGISSHE